MVFSENTIFQNVVFFKECVYKYMESLSTKNLSNTEQLN